MRTEGGGVGISASLFCPRSSVLRYILENFYNDGVSKRHETPK
jgi:hypothetical protein